MFINTTTVLIASTLVVVYLYFKYFLFGYWRRYNVPCEKPIVLLGNIPILYILGYLSIGDWMKASYEKFKKYPFHGIYVFHKPVLVVNDPELVKTVLIKDFSKFVDRGWFFNVKVDPLSDNLFTQPGEKWRRLRSKFSPTFTPQKLKNFHVLMASKSEQMIKIMDEETKRVGIIEIMNIARRYTTDIICSVVYGVDTGSLKNAQSEFRKFGMKIANFGRMNQLFSMFLPEILEKITIPMYNAEVKNFFVDIFKEVVDYRRKNNVVRQDMLNLLMQLVDKGTVEDDEKVDDSSDKDSAYPDKVSMLEAAAQAFVFFLGGIETSSSSISYCLFELGLNQEVQRKLQEEIDAVYDSPNGVTYDSLMEMEYLEMVVMETMRKYPPVAVLNRMAMEDYPVPGSDYVIPKGMRLVIPVTGIHNDPTHYPDPKKFDPTRHTKENIATRNPCIELAFGKGSRDCIGKRYGVVQVKQAIVAVLRTYNVTVNNKTRFPITFNTENFIQQPEHGIYLLLEKRINEN